MMKKEEVGKKGYRAGSLVRKAEIEGERVRMASEK